ncbi:MAG: type IV pilus assembly protein PilM [Bdellovibrionales bacterium]
MFFNATKVIGLDIGTSTCKLMELDLKKRSAILRSVAIIPTPIGTVSGGEILNSLELSEALSMIVPELNTKRKNAAVGMWGTSVVVKKITMPKVEGNLLGEAIKLEAEQYIPFEINEVSLDYQTLDGTGNSEMMDVVLVAAKSDTVYRYAEAVENAGLECNVVDVNGFSLANCFEFNYGKTKDVVGILNIGAACTNFVVLHKSNPIFVRDIPFGGVNFTSDIQNGLGVSLDEAEDLKISAGTGKDVPEEVLQVIGSSMEAYLEEVQRSLDFYMASSNDLNIDRYFVTGGSVSLPYLIDGLKQNVSPNIEILNPFVKVEVDTKKFNPEYISQITNLLPTVMGLAARKGGKL